MKKRLNPEFKEQYPMWPELVIDCDNAECLNELRNTEEEYFTALKILFLPRVFPNEQ